MDCRVKPGGDDAVVRVKGLLTRMKFHCVTGIAFQWNDPFFEMR